MEEYLEFYTHVFLHPKPDRWIDRCDTSHFILFLLTDGVFPLDASTFWIVIGLLEGKFVVPQPWK